MRIFADKELMNDDRPSAHAGRGEHTSPDLVALADTRSAFHAVAEHLLAADLHANVGKIGLRPTAGGFGTPPFTVGDNSRQVSIDGTDLVVTNGEQSTRAPLTTIGAGGQQLGIEPGGPAEVYSLVTPLHVDHLLSVDRRSAAIIADWFHLTAAALATFTESHLDDAPTDATLWPEHFDLALSTGSTNEAGINFGGSPGDDANPLPYLYVGPWAPRSGEMWTEPWGARFDWRPDVTVADAVTFFEKGRAAASADPLAPATDPTRAQFIVASPAGETLSGAIDRLHAAGYSMDFSATDDGQLAIAGTDSPYDPATMTIDHTMRFEGASNPDDESILLAITSADGRRGVYVTAYGPDASAADGAVLRQLAAMTTAAMTTEGRSTNER